MTEIVTVHGLPFLACLAIVAILAYIGIHVLKREIIFIDIALAQVAAVGAIAAEVVFHFHGHAFYGLALAFASTLVVAGFFAVVRQRIVQIPLEAVIGVIYAISAAAALFLVGVAPGGHVHVQQMLAGSILWATWGDIVGSACVFAAVGLCFYLFRGPLQTISEDYDDASAQGYNTVAWDFLFYALVGAVITMAVRVAGVVLVFAFLIIPATFSAIFACAWKARLGAAWAVGAVSSILGLLFAARYDFSVGPAIALFLGSLLVVSGLLRLARVTRARTAAALLLGVAGVGIWLGARAGTGGPRSARGYGEAQGAGAVSHWHTVEAEAAPELATGDEAARVDPGQLDGITDIERLESLCAGTADAEQRSMLIGRMLEIDARAGARAAIAFLAENPPLLFRVMVVDDLSAATHRTVPYDIQEPFTAPVNQAAVAVLKDVLELE
jgi:zinc/manganese transport system permease protein